MNKNQLIHHDSKLSDIVIAEPTAVTVLNRFGIDLGVGDLTVASASAKMSIDKDFLVTILNTYLHESYFPTRILSSFKARTIVNYLAQTNLYYEQFQIPNIERHFHLLITKSDPSNNNLELMLKFFMEAKQQLLQRIADDRNQWFPSIIQAEASANHLAELSIKNQHDDTDTVEVKLNDLISMIVIHLQGDHDRNLTLAVLLALVNLKKDITQNNRIRNRLLRPIFRLLSSF